MLTIPNQLEGAYLGQSVTLECQTEAHPVAIHFWTTDRGDIILSGELEETFWIDRLTEGQRVLLQGTSTRPRPPAKDT